jgi:DNA-binding response OmpR family regulator
MNRHRKSVLCIGDDLVSLNLRCLHLEKNGWRVLSSGTAHDGINRFSHESVDAVVLDLDGDGSQTALIAAEVKRLRARTPVVILVPADCEMIAGSLDQADAILPENEETQKLSNVLHGLLDSSSDRHATG